MSQRGQTALALSEQNEAKSEALFAMGAAANFHAKTQSELSGADQVGSEQIQNSGAARARSSLGHSQKGIATLALVSMVPLLMGLTLSVATALTMLRKKSLAQSLCVYHGLKMQDQLGDALTRLLKMNPEAQRLRRQRDQAEIRAMNARASGVPVAIAAAEAQRAAVIMQQIAFHQRQRLILSEAQSIRRQAQTQLSKDLRRPYFGSLNSQSYYHEALAVETQPKTSLSPDYVLVNPFSYLQQQKYEYTVNLNPPFLNILAGRNLKQKTRCSVSLENKEGKWSARILMASVVSK